jgi:hypothetical protein
MRGRSEVVERERMKARSKFSIETMSGAGRLKREPIATTGHTKGYQWYALQIDDSPCNDRNCCKLFLEPAPILIPFRQTHEFKDFIWNYIIIPFTTST